MKKNILFVFSLLAVFGAVSAQDCNMNEIAKKHFYRADAIFTETATENDLKFVINEYNNVLKYAPNCPIVYFNLGLINEKLAKNKPYLYNIVIQNYSKYLELSPNASDKEAVQNKIYEIKGKITDLINNATTEEQMKNLVLNYYNKILENEPNRSDIYFNLALIYEKLSQKSPLSDNDASDYFLKNEYERLRKEALLFLNYASDCFEKYLELEPNAPNKEQIKNKLYEIDGKRDLSQINRNKYLYLRDYPRYQVGTGCEPGMIYQGGIIFYVDKSGKHGLIVATENQGDNVVWSKENIKIGATKKEIGSGRNNTEIIVKKLGDGVYAAKLCYDLVLNGYNDWFLPSRDELTMLYWNLFGAKVTEWKTKNLKEKSFWNGRFRDWEGRGDYAYNLLDYNEANGVYYWSSSEDYNTYAVYDHYLVSPYDGSYPYCPYRPYTPTIVRAIRTF